MSGDTTQYVLDLAATLPVVVSDTEAVYLYGLDIIAQQQAERQYYFSDGLGSVRHPSTGLRAGLLDSAGEVQANYAYDPFGVPVVVGDVSKGAVCTDPHPSPPPQGEGFQRSSPPLRGGDQGEGEVRRMRG